MKFSTLLAYVTDAYGNEWTVSFRWVSEFEQWKADAEVLGRFVRDLSMSSSLDLCLYLAGEQMEAILDDLEAVIRPIHETDEQCLHLSMENQDYDAYDRDLKLVQDLVQAFPFLEAVR